MLILFSNQINTLYIFVILYVLEITRQYRPEIFLGNNVIPTPSFEKWRFVFWSSENAVAFNLLENGNFLFWFHCNWKWIKYLWRSISRNIKSQENRMLDFTTVFIHEDIWFIISSSFWRKNITHIYNVIIVQIQKLQKMFHSHNAWANHIVGLSPALNWVIMLSSLQKFVLYLNVPSFIL